MSSSENSSRCSAIVASLELILKVVARQFGESDLSAPAPGIDVVYLWADMTDPEWLARRAAYAGEAPCYTESVESYSIDELKYSLRSLCDSGLPFEKLHLVVDQQLPDWIDASREDIAVVEVKDLVGDCYPNYNSQAIESFFASIPDIKERFLYCNDDFFFGGKRAISDYFSGSGLPIYRTGRMIAPAGDVIEGEDPDRSAHRNASNELNRIAIRKRRLTVRHRPYPHTRSLFHAAEAEFPEAFARTRESKFRGSEMYALHSFLVPHFGFESKLAEFAFPDLLQRDLFHWCDRDVAAIANCAHDFCVQELRGEPFSKEHAEAYRSCLKKRFSKPSRFERRL